MSKYFSVVIAFYLVLFADACRSRQQTKAEQASDSTTKTTQTEAGAEVSITDRLAELGLTNDSDWRSINLGDEFTKVKSAEKGEPFESDAKHVGYTIEFKNLESADMLYYQTNQKVSAIDVDLFLNSRQSVDAYQKELGSYFTSHYGTSKPGNKGTIWTSTTGKMVTLKDVSKGKDFGLKIKIGASSGAVTASAK